MTEETNRPRNAIFVAIIITYLVLLLGIVFLGQTSVEYKRDNELLNKGLLKAIEEAKASNQLLNESMIYRNMLKAENTKLEDKINNLDCNPELLKLSMISYIKKNYPKTSTVVATSISENVLKLSEENEVSPLLVFSIIEVESWFTPSAKSKVGAIGLMQVMPEWVPKLKCITNNNDLYEIDKNITTGISVFKIHLKEQKGDVEKALYYYVNKDKEYATKVFCSLGTFALYRSTLNLNKDSNDNTN